MQDTFNTTEMRPITEGSETASGILYHVFRALQDKGYDPIAQLVGFVLTGDPTYITSHNSGTKFWKNWSASTSAVTLPPDEPHPGPGRGGQTHRHRPV